MSGNIKPAIIVFPGSNCEKDTAQAILQVYGLTSLYIWHGETSIPKDITHLILPGGFSFGDYLRAGALAARSPIIEAVKQLAEEGCPILGVCNGFQILCEANLLPGVLLKNHHDRFVCKLSEMTWFGARKRLLMPIKVKLPIAHREGRYFADSAVLKDLHMNQRIVLSYNDKDEQGDAHINGAKAGIAGIIGGPHDNIVGLMPHPERMMQDYLLGEDGRLIMDDFLFG